MPGHPQKKKVSGVGMGGDPHAGPQQPTDPPRVLGWGCQGSVGLVPDAVGHCAAGNGVLGEAGERRQGSLAWCYLNPGGLRVYYPRGKTGRILSSICKSLC